MPCVGFHSHGTCCPALAMTLGLGSLPINTHFPTDLILFTSTGSLPPHVTGRKIIPPSSDPQAPVRPTHLSLKQTLFVPQFPKAFCNYSREASRNRTVRKVLSDYYCIILSECYKYTGAPLDTTQLPGGAGSAPLCLRRLSEQGSEAAAGSGGILGHNLM